MNEHLHTMALAAMYEAIGRMFLDLAAIIVERHEEAGYVIINEPPVEDDDTEPVTAVGWSGNND